jgi:hypothetical protein
MAENKQTEEFQDEEPMEIGAGFVIKVLAIGLGLVTIIIGVPYLIMK